MENNTNQDSRKKKKRVIPFFWWFGGAVAGGGLITLALLLAGRNNQIGDLQQQLTDNEAAYTRERANLSEELANERLSFDSLMTVYFDLSEDLDNARVRNSRLASANASFSQQITKFQAENEGLQASIDKYLAENQSLNSRIDAMNSQMEDLQAQLKESKDQNSGQAQVINEQSARIAADSASSAEEAILRAAENASGYFNNTYLTGAYGLKDIAAPYSNYFYGAGTINGYAINRHFMSGVGLGLYMYDEGLMAPVYLNFRYNIKKTGLMPYLFADGGLMLKFDEFEDPALFINPGIGLMKDLSDKLALQMDAGFLVQKTTFRASFLQLKMGLVFRSKKLAVAGSN